jgi:hypothetical protein
MKKFLFILIILNLGLSACNLAAAPLASTGTGEAQAWFDAPLPNSLHPLAPLQVVAHASDPGGIINFELTTGGVPITLASPNTSDSIVTLIYSWTPPQPGSYQLSVRAQNSSGSWSDYAYTAVTITGDQPAPSPSPTGIMPVPLPTGTPTPAPSPTNAPTQANPASIERTRVSTGSVYYAMSGSIISIQCGDLSATIQMHATDPAGIKIVMLFYRLQSESSNATSDFTPMVMNPVGADLYQTVLTPQDLFTDSMISSYGTSWLQYQAVIQNNAGEANTRTQVFSDLELKGCTR